MFGTVEAVKKLFLIYFYLCQEKIIEFNEALNDNPELVNDSPYGEGWIIKVEVSDLNELEQLLDSKSYSEITG